MANDYNADSDTQYWPRHQRELVLSYYYHCKHLY